ncbi:MAG: sugar phosphate isomerase/epimerase [Candidatus Moduliflexus flocculans]|nr:sugar phosphate isomerase/epimerase [Candidatus Moduliflexus flocculans]
MPRPVTIFTGQWADLPFEDVCEKAGAWGYDGLEIACWGDHMDVRKAAADPAYVARQEAHPREARPQVLGPRRPPRRAVRRRRVRPAPRRFRPRRRQGQARGHPQAWAIDEMKAAARAARAMGCYVVTGFMGSPIWKYLVLVSPRRPRRWSRPASSEIRELWSPDPRRVRRQQAVKFALEVHPTEIAFDVYTTRRLLDTFNGRLALGFNFDPSHLVWQGIEPHLFIRDFADRIYHVHMKDVAVTLDGRAGILGSHLPFGDTAPRLELPLARPRRRRLRRRSSASSTPIGYDGPLSVEWEDNAMDREFGAQEALEFVRQMNFAPSKVAFDKDMKK